ncbi:S9 family peptidase [Nevskia sp.]|uniref:alpha/beta hydrolase family protein n=1 Tax=Nevskia sp. TaxID=1929292 RepID=UPI0025EFC05F|nr:S9 family peptidase [Nevskia sp.]
MSRLLIVVLLLFAPLTMAFAEVPLADFARHDSFDDASISPDGHYVALTIPLGNGRGVAIFDLRQGKLILKQTLGEDRLANGYLWASDERLVVSLAENFGELEAPFATGEMIAFNVDGSQQQYLFGFRGILPFNSTSTGARPGIARAVRAFGYPIRSLPKDPEHILISVEDFGDIAEKEKMTVFRMSVRNGMLDQALVAPISGTVRFVADDDGFVRYANGSDEQNRPHSYSRTPEQPAWSELPVAAGSTTRPMFLSNDNRRVFLRSDEGGRYDCLVEQQLADGARKVLACDDSSDLLDVVRSFDGNEPIAVRFQDGRQDVRLLDTDHPSREKLAVLLKAFPGQHLRISSTTRDGSKAIVLVDSDRNPGNFYLFDTQAIKAVQLVGRSSWLDPAVMPERRPIDFKARDGQRIRGYLTLPRGLEAKRLPMVVNPHGGPFQIRDDWNFDNEAAALASRGYAVLQVNFRGSGGYGRAFADAGKRRWATTMIDDIIDGTRWAIEQGYADPGRIGISGASYGGYAALMSGIREPDLFRSVVSFAGVFDLPKLKADSDISERRSGRNYIDESIGDSVDSLRAASPSSYIDRLKAPVFIVHGEEDERVPFNQAKELRKALKKADHPHEWLAVEAEGHGFYKPENRTLFLTRLIAFLDRTLAAAPTSAP